MADEDENWEPSPGRGNSSKVLKESSILICNFGTHILGVRGQRELASAYHWEEQVIVSCLLLKTRGGN